MSAGLTLDGLAVPWPLSVRKASERDRGSLAAARWVRPAVHPLL